MYSFERNERELDINKNKKPKIVGDLMSINQNSCFLKSREQEKQEENEWLILEQRENDSNITKHYQLATTDPKNFYGQVSEYWKEQLALLTQPIQNTNNFSHRAFGRVFSKQEDAFKFIDLEENRDLDLRPFSFEKEGLNGTRKFLAANYEQFWRVYNQMIWGRHFYEVIREGRPCCLYFDIEYNRELNPMIRDCGGELIDLFLEYLSNVSMEKFGIQVTRNIVIDLDSTTSTKFSRHLIVRNLIFQNNQHCGNFVRYLVSKLYYDSEKNHEKYSQLKRLFVKNDKGSSVVFVDLAVYSRNRNFRIYKSTKYGKETPFLLSPQNTFPFNSEKELFLQSLICNVPNSNESHLTFDEVFEMNKIFPLPRRMNNSKDTIRKGDHVTETNPSPFPEIDKFVSEFLKTRKGSKCGYLRNWLYFEKSGLLVYSVANNRYCENIGREHKSNHIMLCVDLHLGVIFQKCHDPECQAVNFKSVPVPLPQKLIPQLSKSNSTQNEISDEELWELTESLPQYFNTSS